MYKIRLLIIILLISISTISLCQDVITDSSYKSPFFGIKVTPGVTIPFLESSELYKLGAGANIQGELRPFPFLYFTIGLNYNFMPINTWEDISISTVSSGVGAGLSLQLIPHLYFDIYGKGGYFISFISDSSVDPGYNPFAAVGISSYYHLFPFMSLGIDASTSYFFGLVNNITISLGATYHLQPGPKKSIIREDNKQVKPEILKDDTAEVKEKGEGVDITSLEFNIFPVLFKFYDTHPIGKAVIKNWEKRTANDIKVSLYAKRYMDYPKECSKIIQLEPGESKEIELFAMFNKDVLEITEGTKVSCSFTLEYSMKGKEIAKDIIKTMSIHNRNAIMWDDDRKAAAFVTAKNPTILKFAKSVAGIIEDKSPKAVNKNLLMGISIFETLNLYGMTYVPDPTTPYKEFSKNKLSIDFLQFPKQTLEYIAGDCDDLSILFCTLLESVGIKTAFVTVPGHIFAAFALDIEPDVARRNFLNPDELIFEYNNTWIPLEVTSIKEGFQKAWQAGAKQWREHSTRMQAGFYSMEESWKLFEPVGFIFDAEPITMPPREKIEEAFIKEVKSFIFREIYEKVAELQGKIAESKENPKYINRLGVLYAKYGLYKEAEIQFDKILKGSEYVPALVNMGNIFYLNNEMDKALDYYTRANEKAVNRASILLALARINHELENYGSTKQAYNQLKKVDPDLALQFAYLDLRGNEAGRAAEISQVKDLMIWDEE